MTTIQIISICMSVLIFGLTFFIGVSTDILKETSGATKPYSFHRFQLWLWTMIIVPCFILNWGFDNPTNPQLNETGLILLGIAGATALTAEVVAGVQKSAAIAVPLKATTLISVNFWTDILVDDNGQFSITRLQQLLFTLAYTAIYLSMFFPSKNYPVFDATAYTLMGVSTGAFIVGKGLHK